MERILLEVVREEGCWLGGNRKISLNQNQME